MLSVVAPFLALIVWITNPPFYLLEPCISILVGRGDEGSLFGSSEQKIHLLNPLSNQTGWPGACTIKLYGSVKYESVTTAKNP